MTNHVMEVACGAAGECNNSNIADGSIKPTMRTRVINNGMPSPKEEDGWKMIYVRIVTHQTSGAVSY